MAEEKAPVKKIVKIAKKAEEKAKHPREFSPEERREKLLKTLGGMGTDFKILTEDYIEKTVPYGMLTYDHVLRLTGIGFRGRVSQIHGNEGAAKSTSAYRIVGNFQRYTGEPVAVFDFERTATVGYFKAQGIDMSSGMCFLQQPDSVEDCQKAVIRLMMSGVRLFVFDSIPRMKSKIDVAKILDGTAFKADMATHARVMAKFYDNMLPHAAEYDCHFLMINQTRDRIEDGNEAKNSQKYPTFTNLPYTLPGGRACRFVPSTMLENKVAKAFKPGKVVLKSGGAEDEFILEPSTPDTKELTVATRYRVRALKNKVGGGGYREGFIWTRPMGIGRVPGQDENLSIRELARTYGLIDYSPKRLYYVGTSVEDAIKTYKTKDEAIQDLVIDENPEVLQPLSKLVAAAIDADQSTQFADAPDAATKAWLDGDEGTEDVEESAELTVNEAFKIDNTELT